MQKLMLLTICFCIALSGRCQTDALAEQLNAGVELHDKGDYAGALAKYDAILAIDAHYFRAYVEKSLTLYQSGHYQESVDLCRKALKEFPGEAGLANIYVNYGSSLDGLGKPSDAIKVYKEGFKKFPDYYLLPFNKGMTEYTQKEYEDAVKDFETALGINPGHASSHQYLAYAIYPKNRMAAAMALAGFLLIEPKGKRAEKNLPILLQVLGANVEKKDDKTINISMPSSALGKEKGEDDFRTTEMTMMFTTALGMSKSGKDSAVMKLLKDTSAAGLLKDKLTILSLATPEKKGFFTKTYVELLAGLEKAGLLETAAHIMYLSAKDDANQHWLEDHPDSLKDFSKYMDDWTHKVH